MHSSIPNLIALLIPAALAIPHNHHEYGQFQAEYKPYQSGAVSGAPIESGVAGGPYAIKDASALHTADHTIHSQEHVPQTVHSTIFQAATSSLAAGASPKALAAAAVAGGGDEKLACAMTTVTAAPVTVTITAGSSNANIAASQAPVASSSASIPTQAPIPKQAASSATGQAASSAAGQAGQGSANTASMIAYGPSSAAAPAASSTAQAEQRPASSPAASPSSAPSSAAAASSSSAPAASPSTAPSTGGTSGSKRGILIPAGGADQKSLVNYMNSNAKISWAANWYSSAPPNLASGKDFVPQMYGLDSDTDGTWTKNAKAAEAAGTKYFLSFGEPETTNAKLYQTPQGAASFWMKEMQPYTDKVTIGAPAVLQNTQDFTWLSQFLDACDGLGCKIGFIAIHWFYTATPGNVQGFKDVVNNATTLAKGKPVWVDNFQATGTNAAQQQFLGEVVPWLESNSAVQRYAYVTPDSSSGTGLLNSDGSVSSLGQYYAGL